MTRGRCHRRKKKMGRDCVIEGRPQLGSDSPARIVAAEKPVVGDKSCLVYIDLYSQARKALCERSPYDVAAEDSSSLAPAVPNLPSALVSMLKHSESRKRQKKSHSDVDTKYSRPGEKPRSTNIWVETEEYFRNLTSPDIDNLFELSSIRSLASKNCFAIPVLEYVSEGNAHFGNDNGTSIKEVVKDDELLKGADSVRVEVTSQEEKRTSSSDLPGGLEWLLACRNKIHLTSERPSKKRKLLGSDAGLEKVLIACTCNENLSLCNFCCMGEADRGLNPLTVCNSCNVAVHRKCYGVPKDNKGPWLCSWCNYKVGDSDSGKGSCVLCPKQGGALKPVHRVNENGGSMEFAHLFCCQWMPEVYIEDTIVMEPIMNVEGIKETRKKLVCNICKVKRGACVRCSHGTCRTSFHPICAREARHRMEIWGKHGCDNVELRAFCSKHSEIRDTNGTAQSSNPTVSFGGNRHMPNHLPVTSLVKLPELDVSCCNGDNAVDHMEAVDAISVKTPRDELVKPGVPDRINKESVNSFDQNYLLILKKLIDRGKVNVKDVASEIGISPDTLVATLSDDCLDRDLQCKIVEWFGKNIYMGTSQQNLKTKSAVPSKAEAVAADGSDGEVSEAENPDTVAVKSVPPRRRTKSNLRIVKANKVIFTSNKKSIANGTLLEKPIGDDPDGASEVSMNDATDEKFVVSDLAQDSLAAQSPRSEGNSAKLRNCSLSESGQSDNVAVSSQIILTNADDGNHVFPIVDHVPKITKREVSRFYIHPFIGKKLLQMESGLPENTNIEEEVDHVEPSSNKINYYNNPKSEQLVKAKNMGVLELSPEDEVEGEIIYFQHRLLGNVVARKRFTDNLMCKVVKSLPEEIDAARTQRWNTVLVNQYLSELREAKKLGRKERRHKEAQAVLAAATAAAAASSRVSSFRVDTLDESTHQKVHGLSKLSNARGGSVSQLIPRPKESLSRVVVPRKEHPRSCDICRRSETILKPILVCSSCKVAVHLDCYRSVRESTGPWHCEICEELSSDRCAGAQPVNFWQKPFFVAECDLCGGTTGAFRKSTGGQWVHAFCAEWVLESTFRRGQVNPVEGMDKLSNGINTCCICHCKHGACIKCSYGHCQTTFHPSCARSADYFMSVKTGTGKLQHKAYCENHSKEQRAKAETQKHGMEELKGIKKIRVELERLRLICERIIKREKVKRELVQQSHAILALKREEVAYSVLFHNPMFSPDVSSESATTSVKGNADGYRSCTEAVHRSEDVSMDSSVSHKSGFRAPVADIDQKTDNSTFQNFFTRRTTERTSFSGKKVSRRHSITSQNLSDNEERNLKFRKHTETFEKELVMTSDQASMRNQQLPKGYVYVPVDRLPKEQIDHDASSGGHSEHDV